MASCPVCFSDLPDDFGLIECGQCKSPLFVQMDGTVEFSPVNTQPAMPDPNAFDDSAQERTLQSSPAVVPELTEVLAESEIQSPEDAIAEIVGAPGGEEMPPEFSAEPLVPEGEPGAESAAASADTVDAFFDEPAPPEPPKLETPISDLSALANSVEGGTQSGTLRYSIAISGIDTSEIRGQFKEMISDRRFMFDVDNIVRSIRTGAVKIENVTAVKALLLVHRLRGLPVSVHWEQHVVHQS